MTFKKLLAAYIIIAFFGDMKIALYGGICLAFFTSTAMIITLIYGHNWTESQVLGDPSKDSNTMLVVKYLVATTNFFATWGILITLIAGGFTVLVNVISIFS